MNVKSTDTVFFGSPSDHFLNALNRFERYSTAFILTDEHTKKQCLPVFQKHYPLFNNARVISIGNGEKYKNLATVEFVCKELMRHSADRKSLLINLGGGMVTDLGGFAASVFMRGIDFINIPTTLLAMVDASVGGKTGVDVDDYKNMIGLFSIPKAVVISPAYLKTLSYRTLLSGYAEIIKHGLIASESLLKHALNLISNDPFQISEETIAANISIKKKIVAADFKELETRKLLNFGHTIGHAVESESLKGTAYLHGEAVAIGIIAELFLSHRLAGFDEKELTTVSKQIRSAFGTVKCNFSSEQLLKRMKNDKKNVKGNYSIFLLNKTAKPAGLFSPTTEQMEEAISFSMEHFA